MSQFASSRAMVAALAIVALVACSPAALSQTSVLTYHYDNGRTGQNTKETILTPTNVKVPDQFVRLFIQPVDGDVYAQPLYVPNLTMGPNSPQAGTKHNVIFVATEGDAVFAFDAENRDGPNAAYLWKANLLDPGHGGPACPANVQCATTVPTVPCGTSPVDPYCNITPQIGITSTPVIDPSTGTMYVEAKSQQTLYCGATAPPCYFHRLHALDITTGMEKPSWPITIAGSAQGVTFDPMHQLNRPGLLLSKGNIYVGFGSHDDSGAYHGWIFAYDAATRAQKGIFITTPNGARAGVWMEGAGLAADANGNLFVSTANGTFDTTLDAQGFPSKRDFGDSILKLAPDLGSATGKPVLDYFTPFNQSAMDSADQDLGAGGVLLLPDQPGLHPHLLVQAGKLGTIYLIDRDQMISGHYCSGCTADSNIVQELPNSVGTMGVPAYWNSRVYFRGSTAPWNGGQWDGVLRGFSLINGLLSSSPVISIDPPYAGNMTISANGNTNGIVWIINNNNSPIAPVGDVLNAYDALNPSILLYSSDRNRNRDYPGDLVKFTTPIVANGRVYVGAKNQLAVFGLDTVRVQVTNIHLSGASVCVTVTAVDAATGRQVSGTVSINGNVVGQTNQQICFPSPCPSLLGITIPCPVTVTVTFASFPPAQISVWVP